LNCCIPAVVKRTESSVGTSEDEGTILCPFPSINSKNFFLISDEVIFLPDNTTAQHRLSIVNDQRLPWSDSALGFGEKKITDNFK